MHTLTLVVVPGAGAQRVEVDPEDSLATFAASYGLNGRQLIVDGSQVSADEWSETPIGRAREIFATGAVKGN